MRLRPAPLVIALTLVLLALPPPPAAQQAAAPGAASPLPPATPVQDLKSLAGKWEGRIMPRRGGSEPGAWIIRADGSFDLEPFGHRGVLELSEGKLRYRNLTTGRGGTVTLHEGGGRRVLRAASASGDFTFEFTAVPAGAPRAAGPRPAIRIGILTSSPVKQEYQRVLEELGYVDGKTIALEYRLGPPGRKPHGSQRSLSRDERQAPAAPHRGGSGPQAGRRPGEPDPPGRGSSAG